MMSLKMPLKMLKIISSPNNLTANSKKNNIQKNKQLKNIADKI